MCVILHGPSSFRPSRARPRPFQDPGEGSRRGSTRVRHQRTRRSPAQSDAAQRLRPENRGWRSGEGAQTCRGVVLLNSRIPDAAGKHRLGRPTRHTAHDGQSKPKHPLLCPSGRSSLSVARYHTSVTLLVPRGCEACTFPVLDRGGDGCTALASLPIVTAPRRNVALRVVFATLPVTTPPSNFDTV